LPCEGATILTPYVSSMSNAHSLVIRDVQPTDAEGIIGVFNPIIEAGTHTVFDAPSPRRVSNSAVLLPYCNRLGRTL
jgi:hypothetical protein